MSFVGLRQLWHSRRPNHHKEQKTQKQMVVMKNAQDTRQTEDKKYDKSRWQHWKNANNLIDDHHPTKETQSDAKTRKKEKKRFTEEGRLSSLLSTKEFLLYLFASSWGQQFRACNRIKQYNKQLFRWRHVGKWIEAHSVVTQKKTN